jgi:microcystin-dependent protein
MPRSSGGVCTPPAGTSAISGTTIEADPYNNRGSDIYSILTDSLSRSGKGGMTADLAMGMNKITGLGTATDPTDGTNKTYVDTALSWLLTTLDLLMPPIGTVIDFAGTESPDSNWSLCWMPCYGQAVSRTTYATLFARIGTAWGAGDGSTTFNLPDYRGRLGIGKDNMGGSAAYRITTAGSGVDGLTLGASGGYENVALIIENLPSHDHGGVTSTIGDHAHGYVRPDPTIFFGGGGGQNVPVGANSTTDPGGSHNHTITAQGSGWAHNNVQPGVVVNKLIRVL